MVQADFALLNKTWTRSSLSRKQKLQVYVALIESKLLYSMASLTLTVAQQRTLNGFQNRCLRKVLGIAPAYWSRISNAVVLEQARCVKLSALLLQRQLTFFGKIALSEHRSSLRLEI